MNVDTLYKVFKAVLASHEVTRLQVETSLWQVECAEHMTALNQALHKENRARLNIKDEQLKKIRNFFSERHHTEIDDDTNYPQAIYDDECEMLRAITTQADLVSRCLGPGARRELLASTGEGPYLPRFVGTLKNRDSITHALGGGCMDAGTDMDSNSDFDSDHGKDDDDHDRLIMPRPYPLFLWYRGPQQKSKAKVPKPPRGSGLNPSGEPAINQLRIPTEQLQMSYFGFDAHETTHNGTQSPSFDNQSSWDFFQNQPSFEVPPQGSYPDKHYSFQGATGSTASTSEIPQTDIMHMAPYPTTRPQIPSTIESSMSQIATLSTYTDPTPTIIVPDATINQTMKGAMKLVMHKLFSLNAMTVDKAPKKAMLTKVIQDSLPQCFGPNAMVTNFITSKCWGEVANAFETEEEQLERLKYIWALSGRELHGYTPGFLAGFEYLGCPTTQAKSSKLIPPHINLCSLDEQYEIHVQMDPFGGMSGNWKFLAIVKAMDDLTSSPDFKPEPSGTRCMYHKVAGVICMWWTSAAVKSKDEELHVNILIACIPDNAIITWRSATPKKRRGYNEEDNRDTIKQGADWY
ncbi:uncharacterized protein F5147DRAFT_647392 [Suillus discolor]|uniref:Uncharacterized protein n=1 Tax=Suillus discolor TaxID=1912936 RepID=A0A9P7FMH0_9AGAM|nr:uncharacterized protein F5147DRAFT_647392 [Suillus discolor]KAG2121047.1 hypothetical protein F5147DRAFT_647392 [Suillus discolor]